MPYRVAVGRDGKMRAVRTAPPAAAPVAKIEVVPAPVPVGEMAAARATGRVYYDPPIFQDAWAGTLAELPPNAYPPMDAVWFDQGGSVGVPNPGPVVVVTFTVPAGYDGVIKKLAIVFLGAGFTDFSGAVVWQILVDGLAVQNYENIKFQLGSLPAPSDTQIVIRENQVVTVQVSTTVPPPPGSNTACRLQGWWWPKTRKHSATQGVK